MLANVIVESCNLALGYSERLLKDIPADQFARFAAPGGQVVVSNHPAFVFGHLALYPKRIITDLGGNPQDAEVSETFSAVFSKDASCQDDPSGTIYPAMNEVVEAYFRSYRAALATIAASSDETFAQPNPNEAMRKRFTTLGSMHAFYCSGHLMMHLGQISAWRRMLLLPAA